MTDPSIFKAYDVRGTYPDQMDEELAYLIGRGFDHQTAEDTTTGPPVPMGRRGAWPADHVADDEEAEQGPSLAEAAPGAKEQEEKERGKA